MNPDLLRSESFENLYLNKELEWGLLCFNQAHQKQEVLKLTCQADEIIQLLEKGWEKHLGRTTHILRAPEAVICDLSEFCINECQDPLIVRDFYKYLNTKDFDLSQIEKRLKIKIVVLNNLLHTSEVRVAGSEAKVNQVPKMIFDSFCKKNKLKIRKEKNTYKDLNSMKDFCRKYHDGIYQKYNKMGQLIPNNPKVPNINIWNYFKSYDYYVFVPKSSIKYCLSFLNVMEKEYTDKIVLWEYHTGNDVNREIIFNDVNMKNKRILVIDRSFSGYTLTHLSQKIKELGAKKVDRLALFPKSYVAVLNSEYFVFWNRIFKSKNVDLRDDWACRLFNTVHELK